MEALVSDILTTRKILINNYYIALHFTSTHIEIKIIRDYTLKAWLPRLLRIHGITLVYSYACVICNSLILDYILGSTIIATTL